MKITGQNLLVAGYDDFNDSIDVNIIGYQKRIINEEGQTKYYITFKDYETSIRKTLNREDFLTFFFDVEVILYLPNNNLFKVKYYIGEQSSIEEVESFYSELYEKTGCIIDQNNN